MTVKKYSAKTVQEALRMVRDDLGPDATVLGTREVTPKGLLRWLPAPTRIEVTASSVEMPIPRDPPRSRPAPIAKPPEAKSAPIPHEPSAATQPDQAAAATETAARDSAAGKLDDGFRDELVGLQQLVSQLRTAGEENQKTDLPDTLFATFTDLIEADIAEEVARDLLDQVRAECSVDQLSKEEILTRVALRIEAGIHVSGGIQVPPDGRRLVALVGPTGVGKTTTIAKLAANFRLREKRKVGLITVDTYRIAAVDQLQTYADIIDLPLEVVSTPREMRAAIDRLQDQELVLMDTAGRSPRDEVKVQELKSMLAEAQADEVHLVLSSVAGAKQLSGTVKRFAAVGATSLIMTKLDEATSLGHLLSLCRESGLDISYLTDGQNVPDDISIAKAEHLTTAILGQQASLKN